MKRKGKKKAKRILLAAGRECAMFQLQTKYSTFGSRKKLSVTENPALQVGEWKEVTLKI